MSVGQRKRAREHSVCVSNVNIACDDKNRYLRRHNRLPPKNYVKCQKIPLFDFDHYLAEVGR